MSKDKVALIIGTGDYLGSAIALRFAKEGFHSVGTRRRGNITSFVKKIEDSEDSTKMLGTFFFQTDFDHRKPTNELNEIFVSSVRVGVRMNSHQ